MQLKLFSGMGLANLLQNPDTLTSTSSDPTNGQGDRGFSNWNWTHAKLHTKAAAIHFAYSANAHLTFADVKATL